MQLSDKKANTDQHIIRCPLCLKAELYDNQDLVCSHCNKDNLELTRNSCIENDLINEIARNKINNIFESCKDFSNFKVVQNDIDKSLQTPQPSTESIKTLALQLIKLDILNTELKIKTVDKTQEVLDLRINELKKLIDLSQDKFDTRKEKLDSTCLKLFENYEIMNHDITTKILEYRFEKINQIEKQSLQLQHTNYKILKELIFSSKDSKTGNLKYIAKLKSSSHTHLLFHNQPVLKINDFFSYNNKLPQINEYLENLIKLQVHLLDVFKDDSIELPYLKELEYFLPDSKFYGLVQEKENFMMNGGKLESDENEELDKRKVSDNQNVSVNNENVIKLGYKIELPLSSKTINSQLRRASLNKPEEELSTPSPKIEENTPPKNIGSPIKNSISGKKMIIIPHKILTKPFTKLTTKEYLKFLLIIVKILVNFKAFFHSTMDLIPRSNISSLSLSNTIYQFRNSSEEKEMDMYNFEKILEKVASMNQYFKYKLHFLQNAKLSNEKPDMSISSLLGLGSLNSFNIHSTSNSGTDSRISNSPNSTPKSKYMHSRNKKPARIYAKFFNESIHKPNDQEIYGNISETKDHDSQLLPHRNIDNETFNLYDLKNIMQSVYKLMASGTSRHNRNLKINATPKAVDSSAMNMMAQSKVQLDEWDVVSKMY